MIHDDWFHRSWIQRSSFSIAVVALLFYVYVSVLCPGIGYLGTSAYAQEILPESSDIGAQTINLLLDGKLSQDLPSSIGKEPMPLRSAEGAEAAIRALHDFYDSDEVTTSDEFTATMDTTAPQRPLDTSYLFQVLIGLFFVCATIILLGYVFRRFGKNTPFLAGVSLGKVLGRIHLAPKSSLTFVQAGDKILVVGVTPNAISLIYEYESEDFLATQDLTNQTATSSTATLPISSTVESDAYEAEQAKTRTFLDELRAQSKGYKQHSSESEVGVINHGKSRDSMSSPGNKIPVSSISDDDITSLRGDLQRLRQYLQDDSRE